jgi:hypothetical protein
VFYDKGSTTSGWRYLEAAPSDQATSTTWASDTITTGVTATGVGTGKANTDAIILAEGAATTTAQLCKNYSVNGYSDWFLPSMDELFELLNYASANGFPGLASGISNRYWTSSESTTTNTKAEAGYYTVGSDTVGESLKSSSFHVRAIRSF